MPTDVGLLPTTAPTCGKSTTGLTGGKGNCTLKVAIGAAIIGLLPLPLPLTFPLPLLLLLPLALDPVGVFGDDEEGEVDCDEELAAD